jgi:predicted nucleotidyltransferase
MIGPIRLRDFIEDRDGWLYAVSAYDNAERVGCVLRYAPDPAGERQRRSGERYHKFDFDEAYEHIRRHKPEYLDVMHRVPICDVRRVYRPQAEFPIVIARDPRVGALQRILGLPRGYIGCTGSLLVGLGAASSDIDLVAYGDAWFAGQKRLQAAIGGGEVSALSDEMWRTVYAKREPEIRFDQFVLHERRKWNRGVIGGTYFDLLFSRSYDDIATVPIRKGRVLGLTQIEATVTDTSHAFDSPAIYEVEHEQVSRVLSFTHTYSGQAVPGEVIEARGVLEQHDDEYWLVVGTTRTARGEYILSRTLLEACA